LGPVFTISGFRGNLRPSYDTDDFSVSLAVPEPLFLTRNSLTLSFILQMSYFYLQEDFLNKVNQSDLQNFILDIF